MRLRLGQGEDRIDISHTSELRPGDVIVVTFPTGSNGWIKFGGSERFLVFGIDQSQGTVGVYDEDGTDHYFAGGSKESLLAELSKETSWSSLEIFRPRSANSLERMSPSELELLDGAISLGLPSNYGPVDISLWSEARVGDLVYSVAEYGGVRRLWEIVDMSGDTWGQIRLVASDSSSDTVGETNNVQLASSPDHGREILFREGVPWPGEEGPTVERPGKGGEQEDVLLYAALGVGTLLMLSLL